MKTRNLLLVLILTGIIWVAAGRASVEAQDEPEPGPVADEEALSPEEDATAVFDEEPAQEAEPAEESSGEQEKDQPPALPRGPVRFPELSEDLRRARQLELPEEIGTAPDLLEDLGPAAPVTDREGTETASPTGPLQADTYRITGNQYLLDRILRDTAETFILRQNPEGRLTAADIDDAAYGIEQLYHQRGFPDAKGDWRLGAGGEAVIEVREGPQVSLGEIAIQGNETFPEEELQPYFTRATRKRVDEFSALFNRLGREELPYVEADVDVGRRDIRNYYINQGFFDVEVSEPQVNVVDGRANVTVRVEEGPRFSLGDIVFVGNENFGEPPLLNVVLNDGKKPQYFTQRWMRRAAGRLVEFYKGHGYFSVVVESMHEEVAREDLSVDVTFTIRSGPIFRVTEFRLEGQEDLRPEYFRRMIQPVLEERYDPEVIRDVHRKMVNTGLFRTLQLEPYVIADAAETPPDTPGRVGLDVQAEEAKDLLVSLYGGYSSFEGPVGGVRFDDLNLFGMGRTLTLRADYSGIGLNGEVIFNDPWLLGRAVDFQLTLQAQTREYDGYRHKSFDLIASAIWEISEKTLVTAELGGELADVDPLRLPVEFLGPTNYQTVFGGATVSLDHRNDPLLPSRGWRAVGGLEYFSSAVEHLRGNLRASLHVPLEETEKHILHFGGQMSALFGVGDLLALPIDQRFFNGGADSVRSFRRRELGPVEDGSGSPIGGLFKSAYTVEYSYRLSNSLRLAAFTDAGNNLRDLSGNIFDDMRFGLGIGLRVDLPVGPLRIDYGINPSPTADEERGALHISFGSAF